jgi:chromatin remodeling complex protein RSC6
MPTKKKPAQKPVKKPAKAPVKKAVAKPAKKAPVKKVVAKPAKKAPAKKVKRKLNPALMKPIQPDAVLSVIVGSKPLPRSEMTKKLWDYIKKNNLQDPKKRTMINADPALKAVFGGKKQVSMFEMTKLVSKHVK